MIQYQLDGYAQIVIWKLIVVMARLVNLYLVNLYQFDNLDLIRRIGETMLHAKNAIVTNLVNDIRA